MIQGITPFLWFDHQAEQAATFYTSIFPHSSIEKITDSSAAFRLGDQHFIAFNGGPTFTFSPAISFFVRCETQAEIDELWEKLSKGGEKIKCGWLKDQFGVSWQIVPDCLGELLGDQDESRSKRVMEAILQMDKLDISRLVQAAEQPPGP